MFQTFLSGPFLPSANPTSTPTPPPSQAFWSCFLPPLPDTYPYTLDTLNTRSFQIWPCSLASVPLQMLFLCFEFLSCHLPPALSFIWNIPIYTSGLLSKFSCVESSPCAHQLRPSSPVLLLSVTEQYNVPDMTCPLAAHIPRPVMVTQSSLHQEDGFGLGGHKKPSFSKLKV